MATNRLGFPNFDEICANIDGTGLNTFTNHKTGIHLLRVGQSVCVIKQFKNISDLEYEKLVWSRLSDDLKNLFVPCEFFENVLIMKPVIDFYALLTSFADIAMNITEICVWLMALLIVIYYVNMLQSHNLYFTDVKMQNFGMILNEDGTIRIVLIDIGSICIHIESSGSPATPFGSPGSPTTPIGSHVAPISYCGQTHCPLSLFRGISHPDVKRDNVDAKLMLQKHISAIIYFAFLLCLYQILTNDTNGVQQFYCGKINVSKSYKFIHRLVFSSKVFEKYKLLFQEIFNLSTKYSTLDDFQNVIKRTIVVLNHTNVQYLFVGAHRNFVLYFNQPSTISDATDRGSIDSLIDDVYIAMTENPYSLDKLINPTTHSIVPSGTTSTITDVDKQATRQMKSALSSAHVTSRFEYAIMPRFRAIDVVHTQFMSHLKKSEEHVDTATIVDGLLQSAFDQSASIVLPSTKIGGKYITIEPYLNHF